MGGTTTYPWPLREVEGDPAMLAEPGSRPEAGIGFSAVGSWK